MAKISESKRKSLPKKDFGLPSKAKGDEKGKPGNYPVDTRKRAGLAKAFAATNEEKGNITKAEEKKIDAKANARLKKK